MTRERNFSQCRINNTQESEVVLCVLSPSSQVYPLLGFPNPAISEASERLVQEHQRKYAQNSRILQQVGQLLVRLRRENTNLRGHEHKKKHIQMKSHELFSLVSHGTVCVCELCVQDRDEHDCSYELALEFCSSYMKCLLIKVSLEFYRADGVRQGRT